MAGPPPPKGTFEMDELDPKTTPVDGDTVLLKDTQSTPTVNELVELSMANLKLAILGGSSIVFLALIASVTASVGAFNFTSKTFFGTGITNEGSGVFKLSKGIYQIQSGMGLTADSSSPSNGSAEWESSSTGAFTGEEVKLGTDTSFYNTEAVKSFSSTTTNAAIVDARTADVFVRLNITAITGTNPFFTGTGTWGQISIIAGSGSGTPPPPTQINITNQAQLVAAFPDGSGGILIPDGELVTIVVDDNIVFDEPIKIGASTTVEMIARVIGINVTYTTDKGAFFQNNTASKIGSLTVENITFDGFSKATDFIVIQATDKVILRDLTLNLFNNLGTILADDLIRIQDMIATDYNIGLVVRDAFDIIIEDTLSETSGFATAPTFLSILTATPAKEMSISLDTIEQRSTSNLGVLLFIDPNLETESTVVILASKTAGSSAFFYQPGIDIAATAAATGTDTNDTQFDITAHGLALGQAVVLKNFTTFPLYNGTFIVTKINTVNSVDIGVGFLGIDTTGTMSAASLDQTDPRLTTEDNPGSPDSRTDISLENGDTFNVNPSGTIGDPQVLADGGWTSANAERVTDEGNGELTINDKTSRIYRVNISTIMKPTVGNDELGIRLTKNGTLLADVIGTAHPDLTLATNVVALFTQELLVELEDTDTLNIALVNNTANNNVEVQYAKLILTRA